MAKLTILELPKTEEGETMIGAILGDMIGAPYEFDRGNKTKEFPLFSRGSEFTDDSVMTIAVAEALMDTIGKTDDELSLVCPTNIIPENILIHDDGWKGFRICGELDFSLIGILSKISTILAENNIGIFAISTFNTDYILFKKENLQKVISVMESNGYTFV